MESLTTDIKHWNRRVETRGKRRFEGLAMTKNSNTRRRILCTQCLEDTRAVGKACIAHPLNPNITQMTKAHHALFVQCVDAAGYQHCGLPSDRELNHIQGSPGSLVGTHQVGRAPFYSRRVDKQAFRRSTVRQCKPRHPESYRNIAGFGCCAHLLNDGKIVLGDDAAGEQRTV